MIFQFRHSKSLAEHRVGTESPLFSVKYLFSSKFSVPFIFHQGFYKISLKNRLLCPLDFITPSLCYIFGNALNLEVGNGLRMFEWLSHTLCNEEKTKEACCISFQWQAITWQLFCAQKHMASF